METDKNPLISVIVPAYNVERYLKTCICSILNQTYKNLEIILVDDGSTDGSGKLCDEFQKMDSRIRVYHKVNGGLSDARNYGLERAKGDFLSFIDSDDVLHVEFYDVLIEGYKRNGSDILSTELAEYYDETELEGLFRKENDQEVICYTSDQAIKEYFHPVGNRKIYHGLCMKIYRKSLFEELRFEKGRLHEDLYITYKLLDQCRSITILNCPYYFYNRGNSASICNTYDMKNFVDEMEAYMEIYGYFKAKGNIMNELVFFLLTEYQSLLLKSYNFETTQYILDIREKLCEWILNNYKNCRDMRLAKKASLIISAKNMRLYLWIRRMLRKDVLGGKMI